MSIIPTIQKTRFMLPRWLKIHTMKRRNINVGSGGISPGLARLRTWIDASDLATDRTMAERVWETLSDKDTRLADRYWFPHLRREGALRIEVPDGYHPDPKYIESVRCDRCNANGQLKFSSLIVDAVKP